MRYLAFAFLCLILPAHFAAAQPDAENDLRLEFYTGEWCPPCYRIKAMLKREGQLDALTIPQPDGTSLNIPIAFIDVPSPSYAERRKRGAANIYGIPAVPQFQLKQGDEMLTAFAFPWDEQRVNPTTFKASEALANRLSITLERVSGRGPFADWPSRNDTPTQAGQPVLKTQP